MAIIYNVFWARYNIFHFVKNVLIILRVSFLNVLNLIICNNHLIRNDILRDTAVYCFINPPNRVHFGYPTDIFLPDYTIFILSCNLFPLLCPRPVQALILRIQRILGKPPEALRLPLCVRLLLFDQVVCTDLPQLLFRPGVIRCGNSGKVCRMAIFTARLWMVKTRSYRTGQQRIFTIIFTSSRPYIINHHLTDERSA